jgi:hypothetical protein
MKKIPERRLKYKFPNYLFKKALILFRGLSILLILVLVLTIIDSVGLTYRPKINIDAYNAKKAISPSLYGYSIGSEFRYDPNLLSAAKSSGAQSFRIVDGYDPGARMLVKIENGVFRVLASDNVPYENGREYNVKAVASGSNLKIYIDNQLIFNVNDSTFPRGEIGLLSSNNLETYFDDVSVRDLSSGLILFSDNFNSRASSSWNNDDFPSWHDLGIWNVVSGKYRHYGKQDITMKMAGSKDWQNYIYSVKMKSQTSDPYDRGFMGITFRHQNVLSSYRFMWRENTIQPYSSNRPWGVQDFEGQIRFARESGFTPIVSVNMRDSASSAAVLVQDLNVKRKYNIKYWELGNEIYAWGDGYLPNTTYADKIREFSQAMKAKDPSIKVGATLLIGFSDWDIEVIKRAASYFDFVIFHFYPHWLDSNISDAQLLAEPHAFAYNYKTAYGEGMGVVERTEKLIEQYAPRRAGKIEFVVTEFNTGSYEKGVSLIYGLSMADLLGQFTERGVKFGQFHKLAAETDYHWGAYTSDYRAKPSALAISLFTKHFGQTSLPAEVLDSPTFSVSGEYNVPNLSSVPYLTAYSSRNKSNNKLYLIVVNKHSLANMQTRVDIKNANVGSAARIYTLSGPSMYSNNNSSNNVRISESQINYAGTNFTYTFPAHSVTAFEFDVQLVKPQTPAAPKTQRAEGTSKTGTTKTSDKNKPSGVGGPGASSENTKIAASAGFGGNPHVKTFDKNGMPTRFNRFVFDDKFRGGVSVALGDVDGDGKNEIITGAGRGGGPQVRIFKENGREIANFFTFAPSFRGGINVATGDVDYDGKDEVVVSQASEGEAWVKVYRINAARAIIGEWIAYGRNIECGADVAAGDVDGDGQDEIITGAGKGGGPHVRVFEASGRPLSGHFFAFDPKYREGISVASGDIDNDGKDEVAVSQSGAGQQSWLKTYRYDSAKTIVGEWKAFGDVLYGARVALADINNDNKAELIASPSFGGPPFVQFFTPRGEALPNKFFVFDPAFLGGLNVTAK